MATFKTLDNGTVGNEVLRDYQHAARIFTDSQYRLSPKYGFLFYVEFDFNPLITEISNTAAQEMGMLVKSVNLPKYTINVKEHNAYNRKNYVQNSIKYDPVNITFHDDQSDNILNFWYDYYSYYYRDPDYADATYQAYHKYQSRPTFDWGYSPRPAVGYNNAAGNQPYQYIQAVRIYSLYQGQFDEYELINPIITSFKHGELVNGENSFLEHQMSLQFETVKYQTGSVTENTVGGFIDLHYDLTPSPNGGTPNYQTASDITTDFANNNTDINPSLRIDQALQSTAQSVSTSASSALQALTVGMSTVPVNTGGYSIGSLGSLTQGVTSSAALANSAKAAGISLAGTAASSLANGLVGSINNAAGTNVVGLAAAAIANPKALLNTVENMATSLALGIAVNYVQTQVIAPAIGSAATGGGIVGAFNNYVVNPVTGAITGAYANLTNPVVAVPGLADGTTNYVSPDGSSVLKAADGTVISTTPAGSISYVGAVQSAKEAGTYDYSAAYSSTDAGSIPTQYLADPALQLLQDSANGLNSAIVTDNSTPWTPSDN
jgi:hypothetical protein